MTQSPSSARGGNFRAMRLNACCAALACLLSGGAFALPTGPGVVTGQASVTQQGGVLTVTNSNGAIINWQGFSIAAGETARFIQPSAASRVLNRVVGSDPSALLGNLQSNGTVFLINPAGIMVGAGARIDVAGFVASSLNLRNEDFLANRLNFEAVAGAGLVRNEGVITTPQGGQVYLVAPKVENAGAISAPGGDVLLAAGRTVQIGDTASPGVKITVAGDESAVNVGRIVADAGRIGIVAALVRNSGSLNASSAVAEGGRILLKATGDTIVGGDARISANGSRGGSVEVLGNRVAVADRASIDVSGDAGGGTVLVGGDRQGANADVQNASVTWFGAQATINADAKASGDGGKVILWADDTTRAFGSISARGGSSGGNGGFVETSGKRYLDVSGIHVVTAAPAGQGGNWLLDPVNLTIFSGLSSNDVNMTGTSTLSAANTAAPSSLSSTSLNSVLTGGGTVTVIASPGGDIVFDASAAAGGAITLDPGTASASLNLNAGNVIFSGGATNFQTPTGGSLGVAFNVPSGGVTTQSGATVNINGTHGFVQLQINGGRTWTNNGVFNRDGNSQLRLFDGTSYATFQNNGTFNVGSGGGWSLTSNSGTSGGIFRNDGVFNFTDSSGGSFEAQFNQGSTGLFNHNTTATTVSMQNAGSIAGSVNLGAGATLWLSEFHGTASAFTNVTMGGTGQLLVQTGSSSPQTVLTNVSAPGVTLSESSGAITVSGTSIFASLSRGGGSFTLNNGTMGVANGGTFTVPTGITYTGTSNGWLSTGSMNVPALSASTALSFTAGTSLSFIGAISAQKISGTAGQALTVMNSLSSSQGIALSAGGTLSTSNAILSTGGNLSLFGGAGIDIYASAHLQMNAGAGVSLLSQGDIQINNVTLYAFNGSQASVVTPASLKMRNDAHLESANFNSSTQSFVPGSGGIGIVAGNLLVGGGSGVFTPGVLTSVVSGDIVIDGSTTFGSNVAGYGHAFLYGGSGNNLTLGSANSRLILSGAAPIPVAPTGTIPATFPDRNRLNSARVGTDTGVINVNFASRTSGGITVDGVDGTGPGAYLSGFGVLPTAFTYTGSSAGQTVLPTPAVLGVNLIVNNLKAPASTDVIVTTVTSSVNKTTAILSAPVDNTPKTTTPSGATGDLGAFGSSDTGSGSSGGTSSSQTPASSSAQGGTQGPSQEQGQGSGVQRRLRPGMCKV